MLSKEQSNTLVRKIVADKFYENVGSGNVLDFGGGTGLDMEWLTKKYYHIFFVEPSVFMRQKAMALKQKDFSKKNIDFLNDDETDFCNWHNASPFTEKIDAVLSNFAVINCIPDIQSLFKNIAAVQKQGGHLIALILDDDAETKKLSIIKIIKRFILHKVIDMQVKYNGHQQTVFLYSQKEIDKASGPYFNFMSTESLAEYGFNLIHLTRK
jgi:SAM-dependent methyltransferase